MIHLARSTAGVPGLRIRIRSRQADEHSVVTESLTIKVIQ